MKMHMKLTLMYVSPSFNPTCEHSNSECFSQDGLGDVLDTDGLQDLLDFLGNGEDEDDEDEY